VEAQSLRYAIDTFGFVVNGKSATGAFAGTGKVEKWIIWFIVRDGFRIGIKTSASHIFQCVQQLINGRYAVVRGRASAKSVQARILVLLALFLIEAIVYIPDIKHASASIIEQAFEIQITNTQSSATPSPFQQMMTLPLASLGISPYLSWDLGNIGFCADSGCDTPLYAWLESCSSSCGPTAETITVWVNLPSGIAADTSIDVYYVIYDIGTSFNSYWGEAPTIPAIYGSNDNGADVFGFYDNFAGSSLNSGYTNYCTSTCSTDTVDNGLTITSPNAYLDYFAGIKNSYTVSSPSVIDSLSELQEGYGYGIGSYGSLIAEDRPGDGGLSGNDWSVCTQTAPGSAINDTLFIFSVNLVDGSPSVYANYGSIIAGGSCTISSSNLALGVIGNSYAKAFYQWIRVRAYPPNGVTPKVTLVPLSPSEIEYVDEIQITNTQGSATPSPFQQVITVPVDTLGISSLLATNLGNIRFCADVECDTVLDAWLENCSSSCTPSTTSLTVWVKLSGGIAADTLVNIYFVVEDGTQNFDSNWGEAPQLSTTYGAAYGAYDNGVNVFNSYTNFNGTSLGGSWSNYCPWGSCGTNTVDNGLTVSSPNSPSDWWTGIQKSYTVASPSIVDSYSELQSGYGYGVGSAGLLSQDRPGDGPPDWYLCGFVGSGPISGSFFVFTVNEVSGGPAIYENYNLVTAQTCSVSSGNLEVSVIGNVPAAAVVDWIRVRAYPPGNTMPSVVFTAVVEKPITATLGGDAGAHGMPGQTVIVSGCNAAPDSISGNGQQFTIVASPSCPVTLTLPPGYTWEDAGASITVSTCSSGPCYPSLLNYYKISSNVNAQIGMATSECVAQDNPTIEINFNASMISNGTVGERWSTQVNSLPVANTSGYNSHSLDWMQFNMAIRANNSIYGSVDFFTLEGQVFENVSSTIFTLPLGAHIQSGDQFIIVVFQNDSYHEGAWAVQYYFYDSANSNMYSQYITGIPVSYFVPVSSWQLNFAGENSGSNPHADFSSGSANVEYYSLVNSTTSLNIQPSCVQASNEDHFPITDETSNMVYGVPTVSGSPTDVFQGVEKR
jgi:hypothetical protein